jgi:hypothetical protein
MKVDDHMCGTKGRDCPREAISTLLKARKQSNAPTWSRKWHPLLASINPKIKHQWSLQDFVGTIWTANGIDILDSTLQRPLDGPVHLPSAHPKRVKATGLLWELWVVNNYFSWRCSLCQEAKQAHTSTERPLVNAKAKSADGSQIDYRTLCACRVGGGGTALAYTSLRKQYQPGKYSKHS